MNRLSIMQRVKDSTMVGVSRTDKIKNEEIQQTTKVIDIVQRVADLKGQWVGHVTRQYPNTWTMFDTLVTQAKET